MSKLLEVHLFICCICRLGLVTFVALGVGLVYHANQFFPVL